VEIVMMYHNGNVEAFRDPLDPHTQRQMGRQRTRVLDEQHVDVAIQNPLKNRRCDVVGGPVEVTQKSFRFVGREEKRTVLLPLTLGGEEREKP